MKIGFIGDIHGRWPDLMEAIRLLEKHNVDIMVQVGDLGWWPRFGNDWHGALENLQLESQLYFIDGNHEDFENLKACCRFDVCKPQEIHPNLWYLPRGTVIDWDGVRFGFMRGARSIDALHRCEGIDWFAAEIPSYSEYMRLADEDLNIQVMVTHDGPTDMGDDLIGVKDDLLSEGCRVALQRLKDIHQPEAWVHGHYHHPYNKEVNGCHLVGLGKLDDCVEDGVVIFDTQTNQWEFVN